MLHGPARRHLCRAGTPEVGIIPVHVARPPCRCGALMGGTDSTVTRSACWYWWLGRKGWVGLASFWTSDKRRRTSFYERKHRKEQLWMVVIIRIA